MKYLLTFPFLAFVSIIGLFSQNFAIAFPAKFSVSPDNSQQLLVESLQSAQKNIVLNIYMITSTRIQQILTEKVRSGVTVQMLVETEPGDGKIVPPSKKLLDQLAEVFAKSGNSQNKLYMMNSRGGTVKRRFVYDHAKYVVIDQKKSFVGSENYVGSGVMSDPNKKGNRGWQVLVEDTAIATQLLSLFAEDTNLTVGDVSDYDPQFIKVVTAPPPPFKDNTRHLEPIQIGSGDVSSASICLAPRALSCVSQFIESAKQKLDVQHLSLPLYWMNKDGSNKEINGIIQALIASARRGVQVRVLINPDVEDGNATPGFQRPSAKETVKYLNDLAVQEKIQIQALLNNNEQVQVNMIHNKGMIADGKRVFVGSINGTQNSVIRNRELALDLRSTDGARYFQEVFNFDWDRSAR